MLLRLVLNHTMSHQDSAPSSKVFNRREALKLAGAAVASGLAASPLIAATASDAATSALRGLPPGGGGKRVIIAGAGIGGLSCGYELMKRGHDVTILEASDRTGGHVYTVHEGLDDGLYGDAGAEQFTLPGYDIYWGYVREFNLLFERYHRREQLNQVIDGKMYTPEMLHDPAVLARLGFNQREISFLRDHGTTDLQLLYFAPYLDDFKDEYKPFEAGLNHLDNVTVGELVKQQGASAEGQQFVGGNGSALHAIWRAAILKLRGTPPYPMNLFRLRNGNQTMTNTFAAKLGERVQLNSPVTAIEHGDSGVTVHYHHNGSDATMHGDYLVCCMSAVMLQQVNVNPPWPDAKRLGLRSTAYYTRTRLIFQARNAFWDDDGVTPNWGTPTPELEELWRTADEVPTQRAILLGGAVGGTSSQQAVKAFDSYYPRKRTFEKVLAVNWATDPWRMACETLEYMPGILSKVWPAIIEPVGRVYFAGAYADNMNWGQEAATRSAHRVAAAIDQA